MPHKAPSTIQRLPGPQLTRVGIIWVLPARWLVDAWRLSPRHLTVRPHTYTTDALRRITNDPCRITDTMVDVCGLSIGRVSPVRVMRSQFARGSFRHQGIRRGAAVEWGSRGHSQRGRFSLRGSDYTRCLIAYALGTIRLPRVRCSEYITDCPRAFALVGGGGQCHRPITINILPRHRLPCNSCTSMHQCKCATREGCVLLRYKNAQSVCWRTRDGRFDVGLRLT